MVHHLHGGTVVDIAAEHVVILVHYEGKLLIILRGSSVVDTFAAEYAA